MNELIWNQAKYMANAIASTTPPDELRKPMAGFLVIHDLKLRRWFRKAGLGQSQLGVAGYQISTRELGLDHDLGPVAKIAGLLAAADVLQANGYNSNVKVIF